MLLLDYYVTETIEAMKNSTLSVYVQDVLGISLKIDPWT